MKFQHRFRVRASLAAVAEFHSQTASLAVLTPLPVVVRIHRESSQQAQPGKYKRRASSQEQACGEHHHRVAAKDGSAHSPADASFDRREQPYPGNQ
jgi:hypothetical protein